MASWDKSFAEPGVVSYAEIVKPRGARPSKSQPVEIKAVDYGDVLTTVKDPELNYKVDTFRTMRVAVGDTVLAFAGADAGPPYVARIMGIELAPKSDWAEIDGGLDGVSPGVMLRSTGEKSDRLWVEKQEEMGRIPARYFRLRVHYYYRYEELLDNVCRRDNYPDIKKRLAKALERAGMRPPGSGVGDVTDDSPQMERVARYLVMSNHVTGDANNPHINLAMVLNTCRQARSVAD